MARRFFLSDTASDVTVGTLFNYKMVTTILNAATTQSVALAPAETLSGYARTQVLLPGGRGATSDYTITVQVTTGNASVTVEPRLYRLNAANTRVGSFTSFAPQTANAGTLTFNATAVSLGTWESTSRLEIEYVFVNTQEHGGGNTIEIGLNNVNSASFAPDWETRHITVAGR